MIARRAFTLTEVLVAVVVVALLTAILLPVFNQAKMQAKASVCLSNFKQVTMSTMLYSSDYDDRYALSRYSTRVNATSADDKTWVQLVLPYGREFRVFRCPSDYTQRPDSQAVFDADLVPGDTYARYYTASKHTNVGYNYLYLSPLIQHLAFISPLSRSMSEVNDPSGMILFGDSVHEVTEDGRPKGGGNYLVIPPCRYALIGQFLFDTFRLRGIPDANIYTASLNWEGADPRYPMSLGPLSGGLWPWHMDKLTAVFVDGHARRISVEQAALGCDVKPDWQGYVYDRSQYLWDLD